MFVAMSPSEVNDNLLIRVFWKTPGKPKNQKTKIAQTMSVEMGSPEITHGLCNFGFLVFWFSQVFWFSSSEALPKGSQIFFVVCNFGFLGFWVFPQNPKWHKPCLS